MPIVQILITTATNNTRISVPVYGRHNIKVISVAYNKSAATNPVTTLQVVQIESDKLISTASSLPFITVMNGSTGLQAYDSSVGYNYDQIELTGQIRFNLIDKLTGLAPIDFVALLLTLQIDRC